MYTTEQQVRESFWDFYGLENYVKGQDQNDYDTDTRVTFCDYVDHLQKNGQITEEMAYNITLSDEE